MELPNVPKEVLYWLRDITGGVSAVSGVDAGFRAMTEVSFLSSVVGIEPSTIYPFTAVAGLVFLFSATYAYGSDL